MLHRMPDASTAMANGGRHRRAQILDMRRLQIAGQKFRVSPDENQLSQLVLARLEEAAC
jgi:hypothetical protein